MGNMIPGGSKANPIREDRKEKMQTQNLQEVKQAFAQYVGSHDADFEDVVCECGSRHYDHCIRKKRISGMDGANPFSPKEQFVDIIVAVCHDCGNEMKLDGPHKSVTFEKPAEVIQ